LISPRSPDLPLFPMSSFLHKTKCNENLWPLRSQCCQRNLSKQINRHKATTFRSLPTKYTVSWFSGRPKWLIVTDAQRRSNDIFLGKRRTGSGLSSLEIDTEPLGCCFANYSIEERLIYFNIIELKDRGEQVGPDGNEE